MKLTLSFFYLLLLFAPTQLGRHFFFDFAQTSGIRSDYLTPTVFFTDIIIMLMVVIWVVRKIKNQSRHGGIKIKKMQLRAAHFILLFVICYLLFSSIFVASNIWAALYKMVKIVEFAFLGFIIYEIRPTILTFLTIISIDIFYTSIIAMGQFVLQRSIGGVFWWLGERTFYATTPGIATFSLPAAFDGRLLLRPYATFPHPNVLGGFLAVSVPILFFILLYPKENGVYLYKLTGKLLYGWFFISFLLGLVTLFLSMSRAAFMVAAVGFVLAILDRKKLADWLKKKSNFSLALFYSLIILSVVGTVVLSNNSFLGQSWRERAELINAAIRAIRKEPLFGVGLNNSVIHLKSFITNASGLFIFQPVHNIYLLTMVETGLLGFVILLVFLVAVYGQSFKSHLIVTLALIQLYLLGLFDHYFFTLQQGQLLFTFFTSLAFLS